MNLIGQTLINFVVDYPIGAFVYLLTDTEQEKRIVTGIVVKPDGFLYELSCGSKCSNHYDFEISTFKNVI